MMAEGRPRRVQPDLAPSDPELQALLGRAAESSGLGRTPDFHAVLARHPDLLQRIIGLSLGRMPDGLLSVRQRELLVLRTSRHCEGRYEWAHHRRRAAERGLTMEDVEIAWHGPEVTSGTDRALLRLADDLHATSMVSDRVWDEVTGAIGLEATIEAVAVVGWFHLVCYLGNAVGLEVEPGVDASFGPVEEST